MRIGLTGGIGCGKSTATRMFAELGWRTIEVDAVVKDVLATDETVQRALRDRWGAKVFAEDGSVDRLAVADIVFASEVELEWLEAQLHPLVRERWLTALEAEPDRNWLVEIPLLFEKKLESVFDLTVCVTCSESLIVQRMRARGFSEGDLEQRRRRQLSIDEKVRRADRVLSNSGSEAFLKEQIVTLIDRISAEP